jgi:RimJ/RimL family protein N-acetyltransferase
MRSLPTEQRVWLRALEPEDAAVMHRWRNDPRITDMVVGPVRFVSLQTEIEWNAQARKDHERGSTLRFVICVGDDTAPVGIIDLNNIDMLNRTAITAVMVGDQQHVGKGVARKAYELVLSHASRELGLEVVYARILAMNERSRKLFESLGFENDGRFRNAIRRNGVRHDLLVYSRSFDRSSS